MAERKLDMGKAWTGATGMIGNNKDTIGAIAGLFFFLPYFAVALIAPEAVNPPAAQPPAGSDPQEVMQLAFEQLAVAYTENWALFLAVTIAQFVGSLSLLALLADRASPTVGEALLRGLRSIPSYLAAQVLAALAAGLAVGAPLGLVTAVAPPAVAVLAGFLLVLVAIYLFVKFSLIAPVIAIEGTLNPLKALARSWRLTKGNSFRLVAFLLLLFITIGIISALVAGILGLIFAAFSPDIANIGNGLVNGLINTVVGVIFLVVLAAIHRQLAGPSAERVAQTFE